MTNATGNIEDRARALADKLARDIGAIYDTTPLCEGLLRFAKEEAERQTEKTDDAWRPMEDALLAQGQQRPAEGAPSLRTAAQAFLAAFGGDVPDWLQSEADALQEALAQPPNRQPDAAETGNQSVAWTTEASTDGWQPHDGGQRPVAAYTDRAECSACGGLPYSRCWKCGDCIDDDIPF